MNANRPVRCPLWVDPGTRVVTIIDQTQLPHARIEVSLRTMAECADAIRHMQVRGAPLIGVTAAFGLALAMQADDSDLSLDHACRQLGATRPTAVNLAWAIRRMRTVLSPLSSGRAERAFAEAQAMANEDIATNHAIGQHGLALLKDLYQRHQRTLNVMTHCNAGWLGAMGWGTALAPVYLAQEMGLPVQVWVSETRPRNQGLLTAWEMREAGIAHTVFADNAAGYLMQQGRVDIVIVGADRVSARGDVANKIGTCLKALAAREQGVPFYAAVPQSTIDWAIEDGVRDIPIEERSASELRRVSGINVNGQVVEVSVLDERSAVTNPGFDVTPARLVTGLITESGVFAPDQLRRLKGAAS